MSPLPFSSHTCLLVFSPSLVIFFDTTFDPWQPETRPTRASVSSYWIGNLTGYSSFQKWPGCCNKPHRPFLPCWAGSRLRKEVTVFLQASSANPGSPATSIIQLHEGVTILDTSPNYYMSATVVCRNTFPHSAHNFS